MLDRVRYEELIDQLTWQYDALFSAAIETGPTGHVPTCPKWTIHDLLGHLGRAYGSIPHHFDVVPGGQPAPMPSAPESWDELLSWTDAQFRALTAKLHATDPDSPAWTFAPYTQSTAAFWARRMAHDTAIHRLDVEHARAGSAEVGSVPTLLFTPKFAADGIEELIAVLVPIPHPRKNELTTEGTILFHAADAGRAWELRLLPGQPPVGGAVEGSGTDADAIVAGTADAVFRAAWKRPSTAVISGRAELLGAVPVP